MSTCRTRENTHGQRRNFEEDVHIYQDKKNQQWKLLDHVSRVRKRNEFGVVLCKQMTQNTEDGCGQYFVEAESDECSEPSPEQKLQLVEDKKRDENRSKQAGNGASDCAIGHNRANHCGQSGNQYLDHDVDDRIVGIHQRLQKARSARCLSLI